MRNLTINFTMVYIKKILSKSALYKYFKKFESPVQTAIGYYFFLQTEGDLATLHMFSV